MALTKRKESPAGPLSIAALVFISERKKSRESKALEHTREILCD